MSRKGTVFKIGDPVVVVDAILPGVESIGRRGRIDVANDWSDIVRVAFDRVCHSTWFVAAYFDDAELEIDETRMACIPA